MISNEPSCDKENINFSNVPSLGRKIDKRSTKDRFKKGKRAKAIRKLTQHLKKTLAQKSTPSKICGVFHLAPSGPGSSQEFICYDDKEAVGDCPSMASLLKQRIMDNDVDSD